MNQQSDIDNEQDTAETFEWSVEQRAKAKLDKGGYFELKRVSCDFDCQTRLLTLRGRTSSYYLKQIAQSLVAGLADVDRVENLIEVVSRES